MKELQYKLLTMVLKYTFAATGDIIDQPSINLVLDGEIYTLVIGHKQHDTFVEFDIPVEIMNNPHKLWRLVKKNTLAALELHTFQNNNPGYFTWTALEEMCNEEGVTFGEMFGSHYYQELFFGDFNTELYNFIREGEMSVASKAAQVREEAMLVEVADWCNTDGEVYREAATARSLCMTTVYQARGMMLQMQNEPKIRGKDPIAFFLQSDKAWNLMEQSKGTVWHELNPQYTDLDTWKSENI